MERKTPHEAFGIECTVGWKGLYQPLIDLCKLRGIQILQIKEKFGGLCFYVGPYDKDQDITTLIRAAEHYSYHVCENCGECGVREWVKQEDGSYKTVYNVTTGPSRTSGWIRSLCDPCREAWDE